MNIKRNVTLLTLSMICLALSACQSPEQLRQAQEDYYSNLRGKCEAFGYAPGTDAFARCMESADHDEQSKAAEAQAQVERDQRAFFCAHGSKDKCDPKPQSTTCSTDGFGRVTCVSQ